MKVLHYLFARKIYVYIGTHTSQPIYMDSNTGLNWNFIPSRCLHVLYYNYIMYTCHYCFILLIPVNVVMRL